MKTILTFLTLLLCACADTTSPRTGESAAAQMGLPAYEGFQRNGQPDSAAVFYWRGNWWVYHPSFGSMQTVLDDPNEIPMAAVLAIEGASGPLTWNRVAAKDWLFLPNGCLPRSIASARAHGGGVLVHPGHAEYIPAN